MNLPALLFGHLMYSSPVEKAFDRVYPDSVEYSYQAVKYLAKKKYKKIALINGPGYQRFLNIYQGYMRALDEFGISYDESLVEKCNSDRSRTIITSTQQRSEKHLYPGIGNASAVF